MSKKGDILKNSLVEIYLETAKKFGEKTAFVDSMSGKELSYSKSLVAVLMLAKKIEKLSGKRIGVMIPTSPGGMLVSIATLMVGKIPVLINYSTGAIANSQYAIKKCKLDVVITSEKLLQKLEIEPIEKMIMVEHILGSVSFLDKLKALWKSKKSSENILSEFAKSGGDDWAVMLLTTGSESEPKVVPLSHNNIVSQLVAIPKILDLTDKDIFLSSLPLFHSFGFTTNFWLPISLGATMVTVANPLDYKLVCQTVPKYRISFMTGTPVFFKAYLPKSNSDTFATVRIMICGADKLPEGVRKAYFDKFGKELCEGYGVTEASPVISTNTHDYHKPGSIGKQLPSVQVKVVERESDKELPVGQEGRLLVKGENVMKGYLVDEKLDKSALNDGWYDTGDIAIIDEDGYIWHRGRAKRFLKIGGEMVSLVVVEEALQKYFPPEVTYCAVEVRQKEGSSCVGLAVNQECKLLDIKKFLKKNGLNSISLPSKLFVLEEIPVMGSGKVDFKSVQERCNK